mmetsp:Transcript_54080/g.118342  ORF Transcript_54080/g.118342 Transcript_54080/m.118342 type:complete len:87 (-) Transcript_54080:525-785(-)
MEKELRTLVQTSAAAAAEKEGAAAAAAAAAAAPNLQLFAPACLPGGTNCPSPRAQSTCAPERRSDLRMQNVELASKKPLKEAFLKK